MRWAGWGGSVTGGSGSLEAVTATQTELGGPGTGTNPEELLAAAHANCFTSTLTSLARARSVSLDAIETRARTRLEWSESGGDHRLASSELALVIRTSDDESTVEALVRDAEKHCPVCRAISGNVKTSVSVTVERGAGTAP